ncbi:MAG: type II toxin-antitoxin system HicB family antitoxin [Deltaproteobacteria bacterium]|nr:type II toxin-antitoxin system HicB family antitoxin [Deltaproteobacteria bacterium]MBF0508761.1 type II toxin-antitoxin system HicB family antitoxin [Deltaproteobacteria bacterium]MBF0524853.1 type II toxin-antitoxin system HicB family antitoxin [Deltaproteobacteria bacterium]
MARHHFKVLLEFDKTDNLWVTYVPGLNYLSTFGETREEALQNTREAIAGYFEAAEKEGMPIDVTSSEPELVHTLTRLT